MKKKNRNQPLYSQHLALDGGKRHFSYVESRYFYCKAYESLAKKSPQYLELRKKREEGVNIMICGYDAYTIRMDLYNHYCDPSAPFGHECVLYALLFIEEVLDYPWERYKREHPLIYANIAHVL